MDSAVQAFDEAVERLDTVLRTVRSGGSGDAIDRVLLQPSRETAVVSLHDSEIIRKFRDDLADGLIRVDAANQLFRLVSQIISLLPLMSEGRGGGPRRLRFSSGVAAGVSRRAGFEREERGERGTGLVDGGCDGWRLGAAGRRAADDDCGVSAGDSRGAGPA